MDYILKLGPKSHNTKESRKSKIRQEFTLNSNADSNNRSQYQSKICYKLV